MNGKKKNNFLAQAGFGALIGFINGFFGGGGGMVVVPVLENVFGFTRKKSHATSIALILPITFAGALVYVAGADIDWVVLGICSAGVCLGGASGAILLKKVKSRFIGYLFCVIMLIAGIGTAF